jgi:guanine nucleotide exchange factor VAV
VHRSFLTELHKALASQSIGGLQVTLADCFIRWKERFLIYGDYCSNLPAAQETIETLCKSNERIQAGVKVGEIGDMDM